MNTETTLNIGYINEKSTFTIHEGIKCILGTINKATKGKDIFSSFFI